MTLSKQKIQKIEELASQGESVREISKRLRIDPKTTRKYLNNSYPIASPVGLGKPILQ
jgi:DNA-binding NarL/FixJ family response regulator